MALGVAILSFASAVAVPAYPGKIKAVQPDGTEIEIVLQGDEHFNWARTTDGYTLLRDENNYWALACQDANGMLVASKHIFRNDTRVAVESGIERGLYFSQAQLDAVSEKKSAMRRANNNSGLQVDGTFPGKGENKLLLLMLNYSDTEPTYTPDDFEKMMNEQNYGGIGSFRDFYLENSYGQLDITTVVTRWVTLPYTKDYYGSERAIEMIQNGLNIIKDERPAVKEFVLSCYQNEKKRIPAYIADTISKYLEEKLYIKPTGNDNEVFMGIIDKLVYTKVDDEYLAAIIDYKTGNPNLNLNYLPYGLDMQLPVYLYLVNKSKKLEKYKENKGLSKEEKKAVVKKIISYILPFILISISANQR